MVIRSMQWFTVVLCNLKLLHKNTTVHRSGYEQLTGVQTLHKSFLASIDYKMINFT